MASNKGFTMELKNAGAGYTALYPETTKDQILGWNIGEVYGPYTINLKIDGWVNNVQTVPLADVVEEDVVMCNKILMGTKDNMAKQFIGYQQLDSIEAMNGNIKFTCTEVPSVDIQVQVWWTR